MNDPWAFGWTQLLTIIGFCITVTIALGSFRTFNRWRREKIEEKRLDVVLEPIATLASKCATSTASPRTKLPPRRYSA